MSNLNDKKLLILGILSEHSVHGYELNELLKSASVPIRVGKSNAYQLLGRFEKEGWVKSHEERKSPYPPRTVYTITETGKTEFKRLLTERLSQHTPSEISDGVGLNFVSCLPSQEAAQLLAKRAEHLAARCEALSGFSDDIRASHPGLELLIQQVNLERRFTDELIKKLDKDTR